MKFKTTSKKLQENSVVVKCGYCQACTLLQYNDPIAYNCGVYGWNYDVYDLGGGICLATGYRNMPGISIYEIVKEYENKALSIDYKNYDDYRKEINDIYNSFIKAVKKFIYENIK